MKHWLGRLALLVLAALGPPVIVSAQTAPPLPQVTVATPLASHVVQWDEFTGRFEAVARVEVRPRVSGLVTEVHFRDGATVRQGDLLFTIDQRPFQLAVNSAQADVARTQAQVVLDSADYNQTANW